MRPQTGHVLTRQSRLGPRKMAKGSIKTSEGNAKKRKLLIKKVSTVKKVIKKTPVIKSEKTPKLNPPNISDPSSTIVKSSEDKSSPRRKINKTANKTTTVSSNSKLQNQPDVVKTYTEEKKDVPRGGIKSNSPERKNETSKKKSNSTEDLPKKNTNKRDPQGSASKKIITKKVLVKRVKPMIAKNLRVIKKTGLQNKNVCREKKSNKCVVKSKLSNEKKINKADLREDMGDKINNTKELESQKTSSHVKNSVEIKPIQKNTKERSRSPEKTKRVGALRSSSAPLLPTIEDSKAESTSKPLTKNTKLSLENISSPKKINVGRKVTKMAQGTKCSQNKSKELDLNVNFEDKTVVALDSENKVSDIHITNKDQDVGFSIKTPFMDSQAVSPLGRKKLVGKVKPIARVKGTVIEKVNTNIKNADALTTEISRQRETAITRVMEITDDLKTVTEKRKILPVSAKTMDDIKKIQVEKDLLKSLKPMKKSDESKLNNGNKTNSSGEFPVDVDKSEKQNKNQKPKVTLVSKAKKGINIKMSAKPKKFGLIKSIKNIRNVEMMKRVKLAKRLLKVSKSIRSDDSTSESISSSEDVTYSFPENILETDIEIKKEAIESCLQKTSAISSKPKLIKKIPKKISIIKNRQPIESSVLQSVVTQSKVLDEIEDESSKLRKIQNQKDFKSDSENIIQPKTNEAPILDINESNTVVAVSKVLSKDKEECSPKNVSVASNKVCDINKKPNDDEKSPEKSSDIKNTRIEEEERYAFPKIKTEPKIRALSPKEKRKNSPPTSPVKPLKKFITIPSAEDNKRRMKLLGFWTGPKKHREASLNALAKVQCLYENESRSHVELGLMRTVDRVPPKWKDVKKKAIKVEKRDSDSSTESEYEKKIKSEVTSSEDDSDPPITRTLRHHPAGAGKYWEMKLSSSEESEAEHRRPAVEKKKMTAKPKVVTKTEKSKVCPKADITIRAKRPVKKKRVRAEVVMDLRDMVVRKRMASLNASAILAASYEKRSPKSSKDDTTTSDSTNSEQEDKRTKKTKIQISSDRNESSSQKDFSSTEVKASKSKMAVIVNQEADVTITGVYSTHTGFCTVSEMQYRISATSHTQTTSTSTSEKEGVGGGSGSSPSYTPLGALSSMHPPSGAAPHIHPGPSMESRGPLGGSLGRRAGCSSAFSAPPHHHADADRSGYYQPAGPLISAGPLHGGFKGEGAGPPPAPSQDPAYSRYQYPQPQPVVHYGSGFSSAHGYGGSYGSGRLPTMGAPPPPPPAPPACYRAPPAHRPPPTYRPPPPPDNQVSPAGGDAYAPQYCSPCYQHPHVPPRPAIAYLDSAYQGCPCPMQSCPKNVHTGPATGNPPVSSGPSQSSSSGGGTRVVQGAQGGGGCCAVAVNPSLGLVPPEALGPPSPARGSAGLDPPHPPRRARLGKAMARKSIAPEEPPGHTMLLMCHPAPPPLSLSINTEPRPHQTSSPPASERVKSEEDSGDDVILIDSPSSKMAPIDLSSSEENCTDSKSEKDCEIVRRDENPPVVVDLSLVDTKKENVDCVEVPQERLQDFSTSDVQTTKEQNVDSNVTNCDISKKASDVKPKTGTKRRCSKLDIDMEVDLDDSLAANGIGEHVKLQKRQKVSNSESLTPKKNGAIGSYKDLIKKNDRVFKLNNGKKQLNTIKSDKSKPPCKVISLMDSDKSLMKKVATKRKSASPTIGEATINKRKKFGNLLKLADKKRNTRLLEEDPLIEKPRNNSKNSILSVPKSKSVCLLDELIMKNNIDRVIESVVKNVPLEGEPVSEMDPAALFCNTPITPTKTPSVSCTLKPKKCSGTTTSEASGTKSRTVLNINNNVVKKVSESECGLVPMQKIERKLSTEKRGRTKSKSPAALNRIQEKKSPKDSVAKAKNQNEVECLKDSNIATMKMEKGKKLAKIGISGKGAQGKRRSKSNDTEKSEDIQELPLIRRTPGAPGPRWSNGWAWEGEPQFSKVFVNNEETWLMARCWPGMRHALAGDAVRRGDSVLLRAGARRSEPPFVARVSQLWENPSDGEMMVSLLWYYRPEHTERGRQPEDCSDEVFASRHRDANSVACIEDKCYVLTYNEYCRYRKQLRATEENVICPPSIVPSMPVNDVTPSIATNDAKIPSNISPDLVLFCRRVYDFRLKKVISVTVKGRAYSN